MRNPASIENPLLGNNPSLKNKFWNKLITISSLLAVLFIAGLVFGSSKTSWWLTTEQKFNGKAHINDPEVVESANGVVAADDARCSEAGALMLRQGGHAVDAAVATALCVGVVNPMASGIGGGAFMVVRSASTSEALAFDMRETAPSAASQNMYKDDPNAKTSGPLSMGVPGELAGLHEAWKKYGRLSWKTLFQPAIELARNGFEILPYLGNDIMKFDYLLKADPGLREVFATNGRLLQIGDML